MIDNSGTIPAMFQMAAKRGSLLKIPFQIRDQLNKPYDDFLDWEFIIKFSLLVGEEPFMVLRTSEPTENGSYIQQVDDSIQFDLQLTPDDLETWPITGGNAPDRYYYELSATGPSFGSWVLCVGDVVVQKSILGV